MDRMERVDLMEENIKEYLGAEYMLDAVLRAMSYDDKEEIFEYICRCYEVPHEDQKETD